jgi:hypothetical protein
MHVIAALWSFWSWNFKIFLTAVGNTGLGNSFVSFFWYKLDVLTAFEFIDDFVTFFV